MKKPRVISALLHPGRGLMPIASYWVDKDGRRCMGPPPPFPPEQIMTERKLYEKAMRGE